MAENSIVNDDDGAVKEPKTLPSYLNLKDHFDCPKCLLELEHKSHKENVSRNNAEKKMLSCLRKSKVVNKFNTVYDAFNIFKDARLIVLYFASTYDSDRPQSVRLDGTVTEKPSILQQLISLHKEADASENVRLEVLFVPVDDEPEEARQCFESHGFWYALTIEHSSDAIFELKNMYEITASPSVVVILKNGKVVSRLAGDDMDRYGNNAVVAWMQ